MLGFEYKNVYKDVFIGGHKRSAMVENRNKFSIKIEELKSYMVEFEKDCKIKLKIYLSNCAVGGSNQ